MRLLLDTHIVVWTALDQRAPSGTGRRWMAGADGRLVLSAVAMWELRLKWHSFHISGQRKGPVSPASVAAFASGMNREFLPLTAHHATTELVHPLEHEDPFDELLLVQAQEEGLRLLTRDSKLDHHPYAVAEKKQG